MLCTLLAAAALAAPTAQPEFRSPVPSERPRSGAAITAPGTPHRGAFPVVHVVTTPAGERNAVRTSAPIDVPRSAAGPAEGSARVSAIGGAAPWRTDTGDYIDQVYRIDERFDGWSYGVYWNKVTERWERGYHTTEFGLDPDYYRR